METKFVYECIDCKCRFSNASVIYLCPDCSANNVPTLPPKGILKIIYDYDQLKKTITFNELKKEHWLSLLPLKTMASWPALRIGNTPLYKTDSRKTNITEHQLLIKDDSQNPSFSFKDRASALVSAFALENDIDTIVAASTGNAGSSLACICANQGQKAIVYVPEAAPKGKLLQIRMHGATLVPVKGTYDDAFELSLEATRKNGWYNRNTGFNPLTIDGKKTVVFELFAQMENRLPDRIFVPTGDGVILCGVYKGCEDLIQLGWIDKMPEIIAVQSEGSDNLVRNMHADHFEIISSNTIADSISVDVPRNYFMSIQFMEKYEGKGMTVTDDQIRSASKWMARTTGVFAEPAASAAMAGFLKYQNEGRVEPGSANLVLSTGSGLKDINIFNQ